MYIIFFIFEKNLYSMHKNLRDKCNDNMRTWDYEHRCWKVIVYHHWVWVRTVCRMVTIRYTLGGWMSSTSWDARVRELLCWSLFCNMDRVTIWISYSQEFPTYKHKHSSGIWSRTFHLIKEINYNKKLNDFLKS